MSFKILKNAGYAPPEVEMMKTRASLKREKQNCDDPARVRELDRSIQELTLKISYRMERFKP